MNVGTIRKMIEGLSDDAPVMSFLLSKYDMEGNVVIENIAPARNGSYLGIHISIVPDVVDEEDIALLVQNGGKDAEDLYYRTDRTMLRNSLDVPKESRYQWLLDHSEPVDDFDGIAIVIEDGMDWSFYDQTVQNLLPGGQSGDGR